MVIAPEDVLCTRIGFLYFEDKDFFGTTGRLKLGGTDKLLSMESTCDKNDSLFTRNSSNTLEGNLLKTLSPPFLYTSLQRSNPQHFLDPETALTIYLVRHIKISDHLTI